MSVKHAALAVAASSLIFYAIGRYGHGGDAPIAGQPALTPAVAATQMAEAPLPSGGAIAQTPVAQAPVAQAPVTPPATPAGRPPAVDESALRYFAGRGDTRRLEAELARLRALYPEWKPPADLTGPAGDADLDRIWKLHAEGKLAEARGAIAQRQAADPTWQPPADLLAQLDTGEAAQRLVNASNAKQWEQVIRIGTDTPALLTCANVDALWRVAEAFVQTGKPDRAQDAYAYVIGNCTDAAERVATLQKALATLPEAATEALLGRERQGEFSSIRDELARRRIGRAAEDAKLVVSPDELRRIEALSNAATTPDDAVLLGFYALHHNDPAKAESWFKTALARKGGAKAAEGAVLALGANAKYGEAEALGAQWLDAGPTNRKAYLDVATSLITQEPPPKLERVILDRIARAVGTDRYVPGAAALGWYAYNTGQIAAAAQWFETARGWDRNDEPSAYGLALARQRLRDLPGLRAIMAEWRGRSERISDLLDPRRRRSPGAPVVTGLTSPSREPVRRDFAEADMPRASSGRTATEPSRAPSPVIARAPAEDNVLAEAPLRQQTDRAQPAGSCAQAGSGAAAVQRGWCLLNLKRPAEAALAFDAALRTGNARIAADAAAGKTYAKLQQGLTSEASAAAAGTNLPPARRRELSALLLSERFYAQYDAKDFNEALVTLTERTRMAPETADLMLMRGWSYFNLGRFDDAQKVFTALYRRDGSAKALSGLTAIRDITRLNRY